MLLPSRPSRAGRRGFTLVELLVVITIIGILVALVGFAAASALNTAKVTKLTVEVANVSNAVKTSYKDARGDNPPDFSTLYMATPDPTPIMRHITTSYQRLAPQERALIQDSFVNSTDICVRDRDTRLRSLDTLDPAEALVFWLSQLYDHNQYPITGYRDNNGVPTAKRKVFFEFPADRLGDFDNDGWDEFYPSTRPDDPPYVYFHHSSYPVAFYQHSKGRAIAYLSDQPDATMAPFNYQFANPKLFQILCPGLDGKYNSYTAAVAAANYPRFPSGANYDMANGELDNITNFSEGELEDKIDR
jgi:prepilin-type N-terminal cleavage/methylation domain-containing protein